jgi:hypothetical protein
VLGQTLAGMAEVVAGKGAVAGVSTGSAAELGFEMPAVVVKVGGVIARKRLVVVAVIGKCSVKVLTVE